MDFGIYLNQYGDPENGFGFDEMLEQAELIDELNYDSVAVGERHFFPDGFYDPWTSMTALGARTDSVTVTSNILILPAYHPIRIAERMANLDRLTGGRTMFGLAIGYRESELTNFGVPMQERGSRFRECISLVKRLLEGERFDHTGEYYQFEDGFVRPTPVQSPRPTLLGGGGGEIALKRAAHRCDGITVSSDSPEAVERIITAYRDEVADAGSDPDKAPVALMLNGYVGKSTGAAREALEPSLFDLLSMYSKWNNPHAERPSWEDVEDEILIGTPAEIADRIARYEDIGVDHLFFRTQFPGMGHGTAMESIRRFGTEVAPQF